MRILVLCTGNSARSILLEACLNKLGLSELTAVSAGSQPAGAVNRYALRVLEQNGHDTGGLRSKSWDEFGPGTPPVDAVITVCASAAGEVCPIWPGAPVTVNWALPDPAAVTGTDETIAAAFAQTYAVMAKRAAALAAVTPWTLGKADLKAAMESIVSET